MNPRERFLGMIRGEPVDRVPLHLLGFDFLRREDIAALDDPRKREIAERIFEHTVGSVVIPSYHNRYLTVPPQRIREVSRVENNKSAIVTTEIDTPKGRLSAITRRDAGTYTTWTLKYPVNSLEDIEKIRSVPWELPQGLAPPNNEDLEAPHDGRSVVLTRISSPFVCVAGMMPYQYFLELCATELDLIKELTALCLQRVLSILEVLLSNQAVDLVWMGGSEWLTPPMASPGLYEELVQGPEKQVIERIHAGGALVQVHCHGNVRSTLEWVIARGADYFEPVEPPPDGDIPFAEAKKLAAGRVTLGGNIEVRLIYYSDADTVEEKVRQAFEGGKQRMVLQPTEGPISAVSERMLQNYMRMIDVWEELSPL
ncbi:MAG: uroporphyrinogen decarboxylase family protein [Thermodesulfobacteriota bacterium]